MAKNKTIWVLWWMWPEASSNLYSKIIKYSQNKYNAVQDFDYPPIIIYSLPLFWFNETGIVDEELVKKQLIDWVKKLEDSWCDLIIIWCNTVHIYFEEMQKSVNIPIFNIVEETKKQVLNYWYNKVWIFASESTNKLKLYQENFKESWVKVISPDIEQQNILNNVIEHVMWWNQKIDDIILLKDIARSYIKQWAEAIVMWCTEIPLAINQTHTDIKLFDTIEIIVQSAVDYSLKK